MHHLHGSRGRLSTSAAALVVALGFACSPEEPEAESPSAGASPSALASTDATWTAQSSKAATVAATPTEPKPAPPPPASNLKRPDKPFNVLLLTLDTTRADHLSCYDPKLATTRHYDELARDGVRFALCLSSAAITPVSHASILTGLNPYKHGLRVLYAAEGCRLPQGSSTLATLLRDAGWKTGAFLSAFPVSEKFGLDQGFEHFDNGLDERSPGPNGRRQSSPVQPVSRHQRRSDATTDRAIEWIRSTPERFFVWMHLFDPHDAILKPPPDVERSFRTSEVARGGERPGLYDTEIYYADDQFGRLLAYLRESGRYENTLIVITADHGEGLGEHDWHAHRLLYQEQIHVPLLVKLPAGPAGLVVNELVRTIDIVPTVIDFLGGEVPPEIEGRSLLGLVRGEPEAPRIAYADQLNLWDAKSDMAGARPDDDLLHCIVEHPWKLIYRPLRPEKSELYNLAKDPDEADNLYQLESDVVKRLVLELEKRNAFVLKPLGVASPDSEDVDALRDLGYLGD